MRPPNVLLFVTDGQRADAQGCAGNPLLATPHLDRLAADGVRFAQAFCGHTVCMPTRATLQTGRYAHVHGVWANGVPLRRSETTLPAVLGKHGYATCAVGKVHHEPQEPYHGVAPVIDTSQQPYYGFREVHLSENALGQEYLDWVEANYPELRQRARHRESMPEEAHDLQWITNQAIDFVQRQAASGRPFFCQCSYHELIPPCTPPPGFAGRHDPTDMPLPVLDPEDLALKPEWYRQCYEGYLACGRQPDETTLRRYLASYYDQAEFLDHQFGRLRAALERAGAWDNTIVLFTTDHGLSLNDHWQWRHGPFLFDEVVHIPMTWRVPGLECGRETAALVEQVDVMPTVLDLCGVPCPAGVQGASLRPVLGGEETAWEKTSILLQERCAPDLKARGLDPAPLNQMGLRTGDWKLITYQGQPWGELYDLRNDPGEFRNLWDDPAYRPQRGELEAALRDRLVGALDPLPELVADY